jgi:SET domain-containing protein
MYRPLPEFLTIKESHIEGLGLFTTERIKEGTLLGISHRFIQKELVRTPLGGFYNHSETPNCHTESTLWAVRLFTLRDIEAGEEITARYELCPLVPE